MRLRDILRETSEPAPALYHGVPFTKAAESILKDGLIRHDMPTRYSGALGSLPGRVYLSWKPSEAIRYALGQFWKPASVKKDPYGYLFVVDPAAATAGFEPDEDEVGCFMEANSGRDTSERLGYTSLDGETISIYELTFSPAKGSDPAEHPLMKRIWSHIKKANTPAALTQATFGDETAIAVVGRAGLKRMSPEMKAWFVKKASNVGHLGSVPFRECWRIDRARAQDIKSSADFFRLAEKIA